MSQKGWKMTVNEEKVKVTIIELEKLQMKTSETSAEFQIKNLSKPRRSLGK